MKAQGVIKGGNIVLNKIPWVSNFVKVKMWKSSYYPYVRNPIASALSN